MLRPPPEITLLRGRTEPEDDGRAEDDEVLLDVEVRALLDEALLLVEGFVPEGLLPEEGL